MSVNTGPTFQTAVTFDRPGLYETFTFEGSISTRDIERLQLSAADRKLLNPVAERPWEALLILATIYRRLSEQAAP